VTTYYVDQTLGNDTYDGLSATDDGGGVGPWKTVSKVNSSSATIATSDIVSFKRGEVWYEQLTLSPAGLTDTGITITAHGSGDLPRISAALDATSASYKWTESDYSAGVTNLIPDPSFETGVGNWYATGGAAIAQSTTQKYHSDNSMRTITSTGTWEGTESNEIGVDGSTEYTFSFYLYTTHATEVFAIYVSDQDYNEIASAYDQSSTQNTWVRHSITFTTGADDDGVHLTVMKSDGGTAVTFYVDAVQLETGDTASDFVVGTGSGSGNGEYYLEAAAGGNPSITEPKQVFIDGVRMTLGTAGSLGDHEWDWGDNDSLGYSTLYVRDDTGDPDTSGVLIEASQRNHAISIETTGHTISNVRACQGQSTFGGGSIFASSGASGTIEDCELCQAYTGAFNYYDESTSSGVLIIQDNEVWDCGGEGIKLADNASGCTVRRNDVHDFSLLGEVSDHDYSAGIKMAASTGNTVEQNEVYDSGTHTANGTDSGAGIWCDEDADSNIIRHNRIYDNCYDGIRIELSDSCVVSYNVVSGSDGDTYATGISIWRDVHSNLVYNNTLYGCNYNLIVGGEYPVSAGTCTNNVIKNNIMSGGIQRDIWCIDGGENDGTYGSGNVYQYNLIEEDTNCIQYARSGSTYSTVAAWESAVADSAEVGNNIGGDPSFTNAGAGDFTLQSDSDAIGAGADLGASYDDALDPSSSWPDSVATLDQDSYGAAWEIGAYVYDAETIELVIADATHALSSENIALTQAQLLAIANAAHALTSENISLGVSIDLVIADATHALASENVALTQAQVLAIANAAHALASENIDLTQAQLLTIADTAHALASENLDLDVSLDLVIADATHALSSENVALTQKQVLAVADATHALASDNIALSVAGVLSINDATHALSSEVLGLTQKQVLAIANAAHILTSRNISLELPGAGGSDEDEIVIIGEGSIRITISRKGIQFKGM